MTLEIWYLWVYVEGVWGDGEEGWGQRGGGCGGGAYWGGCGGWGGMFGSANQLTSPYMEDAHGYRPNLLKMIFLNRGTGCNSGTLLESLTG